MLVKSLDDVGDECLSVEGGSGPDRPHAVPPPRVPPMHLLHRRWEQVAVLGGPEDGATEQQAQLFTPVVEIRDVQSL